MGFRRFFFIQSQWRMMNFAHLTFQRKIYSGYIQRNSNCVAGNPFDGQGSEQPLKKKNKAHW
jgi:hypothetical protein